MNPRLGVACAVLTGWCGLLSAQRVEPGKAVQPYVQVNATRVVLAHVRVVDGTGKPPVEDRSLVIENGKIASVGPSADLKPLAGETVLDLSGHTVPPGLVGMHDHMYYVARDNLEHGFFVNTQLDPGKQPDVCPGTRGGPTELPSRPRCPCSSIRCPGGRRSPGECWPC